MNLIDDIIKNLIVDTIKINLKFVTAVLWRATKNDIKKYNKIILTNFQTGTKLQTSLHVIRLYV